MNLLEEIFAEQLIKLVSDIHKAVCSELINNKSRNIPQAPALHIWLKFYRNSKSVFFISIFNLLSTTENASIFTEQLSLYLLPKIEREKIIADAINEINSYSNDKKTTFEFESLEYKNRLKNESDAIFNENFDNITRDEARAFIFQNEIQFFARIIIPCLVLYGKFPSQLLRNARLGDEKSIKQLAQIDHSIIYDVKISKYIHKLSFNNPTQHKLLIRALVRSQPKPKKKDLKIDAAALISSFNALFSKALKTKKMTAPQIRQLFVNEANLHGLNDDPDLPVAETFYKSIKRNTLWDDLLKLPDKN